MASLSVPPGIELLHGRLWSHRAHRGLILILTFIAYALYHASRKPSSIVKSVLDPHPSLHSLSSQSPPLLWPIGPIFINRSAESKHCYPDTGWAPFNGEDGTAKLGEIDVAFLACYSFGLFFAGHLGDSLDLRLFLAVGMIASGVFVALFGMGYLWSIHVFWFFLVMQMLAGVFQATGWPSVVAVVGNWFGENRRGLIMGIWNAHTSIGNIMGSLLAASILDYGWGWSFILPGFLIALGGVLIYLFLLPCPESIGLPGPYQNDDGSIGVPGPYQNDDGAVDEEAGLAPLADNEGHGRNGNAIGIYRACCIPGVIPFALCLFFTKLVAYTFLYWLPFYLSHTAIGGEYLSVKSAGNLSTLFDVGGIFGGILAGFISDRLNARAITAAGFIYLAIPALSAYRTYGSISKLSNIVLMMVAGLFVNGPYALITTAVSADLGTHSSLQGDSRALATVTAIIDGTGSIGAALGPLLTGFYSRQGWDSVFRLLEIGAFASGVLLSLQVKSEIQQIIQNRRNSDQSTQQGGGGSAEKTIDGPTSIS
ncbi:hypothetical protein J5N97_018640 [Dioscorea zingiberensis]|uniref:Major facilitator superfamily (MFS) profile domain-containing protein n=1 Tax=Dioscorea zingiberensis TaxID=325984 RepID=A0A9D5HBN1_9LILI|nr:hypothetical protein J5N97_018640 [Dioscorea zingiberensis]